MLTDEADIIITLKAALKAKPEREFSIILIDMDNELRLLAGSTKKHIKAAAEALNYQVVLEGSTMIELKKPSLQTRLIRG